MKKYFFHISLMALTGIIFASCAGIPDTQVTTALTKPKAQTTSKKEAAKNPAVVPIKTDTVTTLKFYASGFEGQDVDWNKELKNPYVQNTLGDIQKNVSGVVYVLISYTNYLEENLLQYDVYAYTESKDFADFLTKINNYRGMYPGVMVDGVSESQYTSNTQAAKELRRLSRGEKRLGTMIFVDAVTPAEGETVSRFVVSRWSDNKIKTSIPEKELVDYYQFSEGKWTIADQKILNGFVPASRLICNGNYLFQFTIRTLPMTNMK